MNPLLREAAASVQFGWLMGVMTLVFIACFLAWVWYAYTPKHRQMMEEAARLPFMDGGEN
ncbi:MAG: cbb3-type cytochrome c oxidase subunit 3 [Gemmatimonadota bacterium]|nr:cbb3-type cytochrome c oxidase subunit 3 [Gemmatimonadota bacterium]MDH5760624.1 cbb3-type cytochrome c oxidase subunit 3 [Gemmatimonadota bacterium]